MNRKIHLFVTNKSSQNTLLEIIEKEGTYGKILYKDSDSFNDDLKAGVINESTINKKEFAWQIINLIKRNDGILSFITDDPNIVELVYKLSHKTALNYDITVHWVKIDGHKKVYQWETGREHPIEGESSINVVLENIFNQFNSVFDVLAMLDRFTDTSLHNENGFVDKSNLDKDKLDFYNDLIN